MEILSFTSNLVKTIYKLISDVKLLIMYVGLFVLLYSCAEAKVLQSDATVITVNETEIIMADHVIDSVNFLVMDTSLNALMSGINKFDIHNDIVYCLDVRDAGSIMAFNIDGSFRFKLSKVGRADNEWIGLRHFHIDKINNRLILVDSFGQKLVITDLQGNFIESVPLRSSLIYDAIGLPTGEFVVPSSFFLTNAQKDDYTKYKLHMYDIQGNSIGDFIESTFVDNISEFSVNELSMNSRGEVFYAPMFLNTIFAVTKDSISPCYVVEYNGSKSVMTDKYLNNIPKEPMRLIGRSDEKKYTYFGGCFVDSDRYVYLRMGNYYPIDVFYDKQTKETITTRLYSSYDVEHKICDTYAFQPPRVFYKGEWWASISSSFLEIPQDYFEGEKSELYNEMRQIYDSHKEGCNMFVRYKLKNR